MLPTTQFVYKKGFITCNVLLCGCHTFQSALEKGQEAMIVQIVFSAAIDKVNNQRILFKRCSVESGGSVLPVRSDTVIL